MSQQGQWLKTQMEQIRANKISVVLIQGTLSFAIINSLLNLLCLTFPCQASREICEGQLQLTLPPECPVIPLAFRLLEDVYHHIAAMLDLNIGGIYESFHEGL
jgi:hypothetical protein